MRGGQLPDLVFAFAYRLDESVALFVDARLRDTKQCHWNLGGGNLFDKLVNALRMLQIVTQLR